MKKFAISDIHGCVKTFEALLDKIALGTEDELYLLGDYIDRGPDSKAVIDTILRLKEEGHQLHCLRGNHEELLLQSLGGHRDYYQTWLHNGGDETLRSFGLSDCDNLHRIPEKYLDFFEGLDWYFNLDEYLLVHAGLDFTAASPLESTNALIWIRDWYGQIDREWLGDKSIVHGHTPKPRPLIEKQLKKMEKLPVLDIDAGCVFNSLYFKHLCAFDLTNRELFFQKNIDHNG